MLNKRKRLGLAITEHGITAVEVTFVGERRTVTHAVEMPFTDDVNLEHPVRAGDELRHLLRKNGMSASRCTVGLAACWLASREKLLPNVDDQTLRGAIQIATEREFASGQQELTFDYSQGRAGEGIATLIVALQRKIFNQVNELADQAGVTITAMTASALMTAATTTSPDSTATRTVLFLQPHGAELAILSGGCVRMLRHLPGTLVQNADGLDNLAAQLRMVFATIPSATAVRELIVWDSVGLEHSVIDGLGKRLGMSVRCCDAAKDLVATDCGATRINNRFANAAAAGAGASPTIDFANSRLAPARKPRVSKRTMWITGASAVVVATVVLLLVNLLSNQAEVSALETELASTRDATKQAKETVEDVNFARGWYDRRPPLMDCLAEISNSFPVQGIWATSVTVKEDMQVKVTGKAGSEKTALDLLGRLTSNPLLSDVKPSYIRQVGGASKDVSFEISFKFKGGN
ncbi:MAG: hypothetical protein EHM48_06945 [Planctomycetaceae bacterium]|nr:MAG: hypothetical protein EHM48_06945 [Planctomycetaceae bacterium]